MRLADLPVEGLEANSDPRAASALRTMTAFSVVAGWETGMLRFARSDNGHSMLSSLLAVGQTFVTLARIEC